jgi:putative transposase
MPSRNVVKDYAPQQFYHVYNRGVAKQAIFVDEKDKLQFIKILSRHLDAADSSTKNDGSSYRKFDQDLELLCYCLMGNHFHLLFYLGDDPDALRVFMQAALTAYTMFFNKRHGRVGPLFQGVFKASRVSRDEYLLHISRYIHRNPRTYKTYLFSSLAQYLGRPAPPWLKPARILELFEGEDYMQFLEDYEEHAAMLATLKHELANDL